MIANKYEQETDGKAGRNQGKLAQTAVICFTCENVSNKQPKWLQNNFTFLNSIKRTDEKNSLKPNGLTFIRGVNSYLMHLYCLEKIHFTRK